MEEKIKDYFARYPFHDEVYESGGVLFHTSGAAESYGKGEVNRHTRSLEVNESEDHFVDNVVEEDIDSLNYAELKALSKKLELEVADNKKETISSALKALQEQLKTK